MSAEAIATIAAAIISAVLGPLLVQRFRKRRSRLSIPAPATTTPSEAREPVRAMEPPARPVDEAGYPRWLGVQELPTGPRVFIRESGPDAIERALSHLPPLTATAVADDVYRGRWVRWTGTIIGFRNDDYLYVVNLRIGDQGTVLVTFPPPSRDLLDTFRVGDTVVVEAQIRTARDALELVNATLERVPGSSGAA